MPRDSLATILEFGKHDIPLGLLNDPFTFFKKGKTGKVHSTHYNARWGATACPRVPDGVEDLEARVTDLEIKRTCPDCAGSLPGFLSGEREKHYSAASVLLEVRKRQFTGSAFELSLSLQSGINALQNTVNSAPEILLAEFEKDLTRLRRLLQEVEASKETPEVHAEAALHAAVSLAGVIQESHTPTQHRRYRFNPELPTGMDKDLIRAFSDGGSAMETLHSYWQKSYKKNTSPEARLSECEEFYFDRIAETYSAEDPRLVLNRLPKSVNLTVSTGESLHEALLNIWKATARKAVHTLVEFWEKEVHRLLDVYKDQTAMVFNFNWDKASPSYNSGQIRFGSFRHHQVARTGASVCVVPSIVLAAAAVDCRYEPSMPFVKTPEGAYRALDSAFMYLGVPTAKDTDETFDTFLSFLKDTRWPDPEEVFTFFETARALSD